MNPHRQRLLCAASALALLALAACGKAPQPAAANPPATSATANVSDVDVTEHVKTALSQTDSLKGFDITVVTLKGAQIDEAIRIAKAAEGAHTIHDELTIKK